MKTVKYIEHGTLEEGQEYQDFLIDKLRDKGLIIQCYSSRKYQVSHGEGPSGIEIKFDNRMSETQNLFFETEERYEYSDGTYSQWKDSGIKSKDNIWLFIIGDYKNAYLFSPSQILSICVSGRFSFRYVETDTARGFLIPLSFFEENKVYVLRHFEF